MKKTIFSAAIAAFSLFFAQNLSAQTNLQTFYDFGKDRQFVTMTLEGYYGDNWGDTFFFIDYDFATKEMHNNGTYGSKGSYFEISRGLNFWKGTALEPLSAHVEFNGGVNFGTCNFLFGANYFLHNADFSNTLTLELMYKTFNGSASSNLPLQFTVVWGMKNLFGVDGLSFSGFADIWGENTKYWYGESNPAQYTDEGHFVFISEPQIWYNIGKSFGCDNLNIGTEIELSYNFAGCHGFWCRPCLGTKWVF